MRLDRRRRLRALLLAPLAGVAASCGTPAAGPAHDQPREVTSVDTSSLDPDRLRAHGFREQDGQFLRGAIALKDLSALLGFAPGDLELWPGLGPDELRASVELREGRCTVDYADPYSGLDDPEALVDARVEPFAKPHGAE